jgi:hypothetical protein
MTAPQPAHRAGHPRAFLVERYLPPEAAKNLAALTVRVRSLCTESDHTQTPVRYLYSAYLPSEDTCFCLFQAQSTMAVLAVNRQANFALDRITEAALLVPAEATFQLVQNATGARGTSIDRSVKS